MTTDSRKRLSRIQVSAMKPVSRKRISRRHVSEMKTDSRLKKTQI